MCEFINTYNDYEGTKFDSNLNGHGAIYGCGGSGKTYVVNELMLNGMFKSYKTIVILASKTNPPPDNFKRTMKVRWDTNVHFYRITSQDELEGKLREIETTFVKHRIKQYARVNKGEKPPDFTDFREGYAFGNLRIILDDLHKEVVNSQFMARTFQHIRHSGIDLLWLTQSFKNAGGHDLIKDNLNFMLFFKLTQNRTTFRNYLNDLSMFTSAGSRSTANDRSKSSLEKIYNKLVMQNSRILTFDPDDTNYLFLANPRRHGRSVFDIRTCITNPNRQLCFQETHVSEKTKILFAERQIPLTYENRSKPIKMVVLTDQQQNESIHALTKKGENEEDDDDDE